MRRIWMALLILGVVLSATAKGLPVAVLLSIRGSAKYHSADSVASKYFELHPLDSLELGQTFKLEPKAVVTLSVLSSGIRYRLTGPLTVVIDSKTPFQTGKGISELSKQASREGIVAGQEVDLTKFGGVSSRRSRFPNFTDSDGVSLDLDLLPQPFEASSLKVLYRPDGSKENWIPAESSLIHHSNSRDQLRLSAKLAADKCYLIYIGDNPNPEDGDAKFRVLRFPEKVVKSIVTLEQTTGADLPGQLELFQVYRHLHLFSKAEALLNRMSKEFPKAADWPKVLEQLDTDRRSNGRGL